MVQALDWAYAASIDGIPGLGSAEDLARDYIGGETSLRDSANSLIRWQVAKAGTSGFVSGLGGAITLPITIPANLASVIYLQIRMVAALAYMGGYDVRSDRVQSLAYVCLVGNAAKDVLKGAGIVVGRKIGEQAIKKISGKTIVAINRKVGYRLVTKFGEKGVVNLGKAVPIIGGLVGGTVDSVATNAVGNVARDVFIGG